MRHLPSIAALLVAFVALAVAWTARSAPPHAPAPAVDVAPLVARIEALESAREHAPAAAPAKLEAAPPRESAGAPAEDPVRADLEARLAQLERRIASSDASAPTAATVEQPGGRQTSEELCAIARDAARTEAERLRALADLRARSRAEATDPRLAVLDEMILLARTSTDAKTRADVWRQMTHVTDPRLERPLLDALAFDTDAKAREEAAETLADFLPNAGVEAALRAAAQNDADARVRSQAGFSLGGGR